MLSTLAWLEKQVCQGIEEGWSRDAEEITGTFEFSSFIFIIEIALLFFSNDLFI